MIEDEALSQRLYDGVEAYWLDNRRKLDCVYRLALYAYPDEHLVTIRFRLYEYPQGYKSDICDNFERLARTYLSRNVPGWNIQIKLD